MQRTGYEKKRGTDATRGGERRRGRGSLKRVNWDAISDRRLIKVTALVTRKDATANEEIRDFRDCVIIARCEDLPIKRIGTG